MGVTGCGAGGGGEGGIPVFGGRDSKGQGRAKGWKRPFHTAMEIAIGGLKKTTTGVTLRGWQWGGVGRKGPLRQAAGLADGNCKRPPKPGGGGVERT